MKANVSRWISRAINAGSYVGFSPSSVSESYHIILTAFGDSWLQDEARKSDVKARGIFPGHPLLRRLATSGLQQVSSNIELATYLAEFVRDDQLSSVIEKMKSEDHFEDHFLELAIAFRFKRAGGEVRLNPSTDRGKGDIEVAVDGETWLIECSRQNRSVDTQAWSRRLQILVDHISRVVGKLKACITVKVVIKAGADQTHLLAARRHVKELAMKVPENPKVIHEFEDQHVKVAVTQFDDLADPNPAREHGYGRNYTEMPSTEWDAIIDHSEIPRRDYDRLDQGHETPTTTIPIDRIFLKLEPSIKDDNGVEDAAIRKAEKKLSQTASTNDRRPRLIVIQTLGLLEKLAWNHIRSEIMRVFKGHSRLGGISFVNRRFHPSDGRYHYAHILNCNDLGECPFPRSFFARLKELEEKPLY